MKIKNTKTKTSSRITALIYGPSGIGKTTLAKTLPGKTLIISAESGLLSLSGMDIDYVDICEGKGSTQLKLEHLRDILKHLSSEKTEYENIFIDSLTEIAQIMVQFQQTLYPDKKDSMNLWGAYNTQIRAFIKHVRDLSPYNIILTALEKVDKDEIGRRYKIPEMNGAVAAQIAQFFDEVLYYTEIENEKEKKRVLITSSSSNFIAKDRSGKLNQYEIPDFGIIFNKIKGE